MPAAKCEYSSPGTLSWHCFENTDKTGRHNRTCAMPGRLTVTDVTGVKPFSSVVSSSRWEREGTFSPLHDEIEAAYLSSSSARPFCRTCSRETVFTLPVWTSRNRRATSFCQAASTSGPQWCPNWRLGFPPVRPVHSREVPRFSVIFNEPRESYRNYMLQHKCAR